MGVTPLWKLHPKYLVFRIIRLLFNCSLCGSEACDGHTEWRTASVVHANLSAELNRARLTTMLTTDTATEIWTNLTTLLNGELDETTYALLVEYLEWVNLQDLLVEIDRQETGDVVAAVAERHLCKVVGTE